MLINYIETNKSPSQLLDTCKTEFTVVEKIVYELAMIHFNRLNIKYDHERYFIEFWWKNENTNEKLQKNKNENKNEIHGFHSDKDEAAYKNSKQLIHPFIATVTYLNDSIFPTIITSSPENNFIEKTQIVLDKGVTLSFPKDMKHICFSPENMHGVYNVCKDTSKNNTETRKTLMFNIWDNYKPTCNDSPILNNCNCTSFVDLLSKDISLCNTTNKLTINLKENEMCEFVKLILKKDTTVINNYITNDTINIYDVIEFDLLL